MIQPPHHHHHHPDFKTLISLHSTPLRSVPLGFNQCLQLADKVIACVKFRDSGINKYKKDF